MQLISLFNFLNALLESLDLESAVFLAGVKGTSLSNTHQLLKVCTTNAFFLTAE